jgi:hypothetical protein
MLRGQLRLLILRCDRGAFRSKGVLVLQWGSQIGRDGTAVGFANGYSQNRVVVQNVTRQAIL